MIALHACLVTGLAAGPCLAALPPQSPDWATPRWVYDAAGIVAGETVHDCSECDEWIACTVVGDVTLRNYHPWRLRPGRWHGWRRPGEQHLEAVRDALMGGCTDTPVCAYLGSASDYLGRWRFGLARERPALVIGNSRGAIVCIAPLDDD